jgi:hypothetical protein
MSSGYLGIGCIEIGETALGGDCIPDGHAPEWNVNVNLRQGFLGRY